MPSNKTVYTLDLNVSDAIKHYEDLLKTLKTAGGDPKAISDLESSLVKLKSRFGDLKTEAATGFTDSKGLTKFSKGVGDISIKMQQLGTKIKDVASNADNFPNSEFAQAAKEIEKINSQFDNLAKTANSDLIKSLGSMGFSKEQAANIAASVHSEEELVAKLEEEKKRRMEVSEAAKQGLNIVKQQISQEYMSKGGKTAIFGIDLISSTIKSEFDDSKGTLETFEELAKDHLVNALAKGMDPQNAMDGIISFAETFESELGEGFTDAIKKALEDATPTIEGVVSNITTKVNASKEGKAYSAASASYQAIGDPGGGLNANATATASGYGASIEKLNALMERATELTASLDAKQQALINTQNSLKSNADSANQELEQQTNAAQQDANAMANAARESEQLSASFDQMANRVKNLLSIGSVFTMIKNVIKSTYNDVKALDKSFASIAMVTNQTVSGLWGTYDDYAAMAAKLGQSTNDVIQASALFYQQGLDTAEALTLTEDTMKLATLAGNDFKTATSEMTAALRGFKMEMDEGGHVTDVYSELAAHAAASVDDIALAMQRTASIANSAGMSFENTSAFLTQMIETTQESAENIGTSMKTIIARFTELKDNVAGTADSEFDDLDFNKVDKALKSVGVSLKDTSGQFRNLDEVFLELSSKWDSLDRNTQRYVATIAAGSRQQSRFIAMMDNYDRTVELMETAADAEGKADEQFAKYADTMEYKLNQLSTTWEQFRVDLMNTDLFNPIIEKVTEFVQLVNSVDFHKFSGKAFAAEIAIMVVSIKNFITNFLNIGKNIVGAAKKLGENIVKNVTTSIKKKADPAFKALSKKLKLSINIDDAKAQSDLRIAEQNMDKSVQAFNKQKVLKFVLENEVKDGEGINQYLARLKPELEKAGISIDEFKEKCAELDSGGQAGEGFKSIENAAKNATKEIEKAERGMSNAADKVAAANQKLAQEEKKKIAQQQQSLGAQQMLTSAMNSGIAAIAGYASGTMTAGEALKSFGLSVLSTIGGIILQNTLTSLNTKLEAARAKQKAATSATVVSADAAESTANQVLAATLWEIYGPLILIALAIGAVVAIAVGIIALVKYFKDYAKAQDESAAAAERLKKAEEERDAAQDRANTAKDNAKETAKTYKNTVSLKEEYEKLSAIQNKSVEEEERYKELTAEIVDTFPEIVSFYDETTGQLEVQADLWDYIVEQQKVSAEEAAKASLAANVAVNNAQQEVYDAEQNAFDVKYKEGQGLAMADKAQKAIDMQADNGGGKLSSYLNKDDFAMWAEFSGKDLSVASNLEDAARFMINAAEYEENLTKKREDELTEEEKTYRAYKEYAEAQKEQQDSLYAQQMEILSQQRIANYQETFEAKGEDTAVANFMARRTEDVGEDVAITQYKKNATAMNRGYFANRTGGGVKGKNSDSSNNTLTGSNLDGWDDLDDEIKHYIELGYGDGAQDFYNENRKSAGGIEKIYQMYLAGLTAEAVNDFGDDVAEQLSDDERKRIVDFNENSGLMSKAEMNAYVSSFNTQGEQRVAQDQVDEILKQWTDAVEGDNGLVEIFNRSAESFEEWGTDAVVAYQNAAKNVLSAAGTENEEAAKKYLQTMDDAFQKYGVSDEDAINFINSMDWAEAGGLGAEEFKKSFIENAQETFGEMSEDEAIKFYEDLSNDAAEANLYSPLQTTLAQAEAYYDKISSISQVFIDNGETLTKYLEQGNQKISVSLDEYQELEEVMEDLAEAGADVEGVLSYDNNTKEWIVDTGKLSDLMTENSEQAKENIEQAIKDNEELIETDKKTLQEQQEQLDALKAKQISQEGLTEAEAAQLLELEKSTEVLESSIKANETVKDELQNEKDTIDEMNAKLEESVNLWKQAAYQIERLTDKISTVSSAFSSITSSGYLSQSNIAALAESGFDISSLVGKDLSLDAKALYSEMRQQIIEQAGTATTETEKLQFVAMLRELDEEYKDYLEDLEDEVDDVASAQDSYNDALEDYNDQLETVAEKQDTLNEKLETYNELLYGSDNRKSTLDYFYNYDEAINSFNDEISRAQDLLSDASSIEEATAALGRYAAATHNLIAEETAKQQVLQAGLANYADKIENGSYSYTNQETGETTNINFGDYARKDERTGKYVIDQRLINESRFGDEWKDLLEEQVSNYNKYSEDLLASEDNVRKAEKALRDERENALKNYVALEDKVKEVLKAEYQEQVDNLTNMYDSMKEADDDYVNALQDAIDKQRALREQENAWEDLAEKEKKLSLMQRDTSGANQVETMKLEEEIQDDREKLLDDAIDDVIEGLSDLYESQSELRDAELELKEALLENDSYWAGLSEATVQGFVDLDDATEWYLQHSLELTDMTAAGAESDILSFQDTYGSATEYMAMQLMDETSETGDFINDAINVTGEEAMMIITETSETFTTEAQRAFDETQATFEADMEKAEQDIRDAKDALQEAVDKLGELAEAARLAAIEYENAKAAKDAYDNLYDDIYGNEENEDNKWASATSLYGIVNALGVDHNALDDISKKMDGNEESFAMIRTLKGHNITTEQLEKVMELSGLSSAQIGYEFGLNGNAVSEMTRNVSEEEQRHRVANALITGHKFAEGGLVDYTGPAWVDGTTSRPEAFLSADDTERIGNAARILADIPWIDRDTDNSTVVTNNGGDVSVEINLNIDHISSDTDIDDMIERVKEEIVEVARPTGTNVILQQQL